MALQNRTAQNPRLGIILMITAIMIFAVQDALSRHLAGTYNAWMIVTIRYWFFAVAAVVLTARQPGGVMRAIRTRHPLVQTFRGVALALQIGVVVLSFTLLGLVGTHALMASGPLMVTALSGPLLGERVGWYRWAAISAGFVGVLVILQPGFAVISPAALLALGATVVFALYQVATRYVGQHDNALISLFWTGTVGAVALTPIGLWWWEPMISSDWALMAVLSFCGVLSHGLLIRTYEIAEASAVQPFSYLQLVFAALIGVNLFGETITANVVIGASIVVGAGLFTIWRTARAERRA